MMVVSLRLGYRRLTSALLTHSLSPRHTLTPTPAPYGKALTAGNCRGLPNGSHQGTEVLSPTVYKELNPADDQ